MRLKRTLSVLDYHTEGEPMRIVVGGAPPLRGETLLAKSDHVDRELRDLLGFILYEPRGHSAMCGAILTRPCHPEAETGVVFIEPSGSVHMCGHGAMAIATMLVETGRVAARDPETSLALDTAAGLVRCRIAVASERVTGVTIENVLSFSVLLDAKVEVPRLGTVSFDLAYGGHFYAIVPADAVGLALEAKEAPRIVEAGEAIRRKIEAVIPLVHPERPEAKALLYVQFFSAPQTPGAHLRNAVVVSPLGLDRSPCGTGTSARMANLHARGRLRVGDPFVHESILGSVFTGRLVGTGRVGKYPAVIPQVTGRAYLTGISTLVLSSDDPFPGGFLL